MGSGLNLTVLTAISRDTSMIHLNPGANKAIRVTGIGFIDGYCVVDITGTQGGTFVLDKIRIDHCSFLLGHTNLRSFGWVEGLIDHNIFLNCDRAILITGDNQISWTRPIEAGTSHSLFIEDNTFKQTNAGGGGLNESVYHWEGARTVIRYNDFNGTEYESYDFVPFDSHGNQSYYNGVSDSRGQPIIEVYNNTFRFHHSYRVCYFRSGSILFHDNAFTFASHSDADIVLTDEESWQSAYFSPLRTTWAAEDQIMNSFFWNNTRNGNPITTITLLKATDEPFIQKDRDYFMHAPQAIGGKASYTGRQGGAEVFSAARANAYYPYVPFTYPHPLQEAGVNAPTAPTGLRIR
jgi:hypothetical protein